MAGYVVLHLPSVYASLASRCAEKYAGEVGAALARDRHAVDDIHSTIANPLAASRDDPAVAILQRSPREVELSRVAPLSHYWPLSQPFSLNLRLAQVTFPGGAEALPALFLRAPGGAFGKVLIGVMTHSGVPAAIKVLLNSGVGGGTGRDAFLREAQNLLQLRGAVDTVRALEERDVALSLEDAGARHVAYVYGTGEERDLAAVHAALPHVPAFLISMEPLAETLTQLLQRVAATGDGRMPLAEALRIAHEVALGLAFLGKHGVVVRSARVGYGEMVRSSRMISPCAPTLLLPA